MWQNIPLTFLWYNWSAAGTSSSSSLLTQRRGVEYSSSLGWTLSTEVMHVHTPHEAKWLLDTDLQEETLASGSPQIPFPCKLSPSLSLSKPGLDPCFCTSPHNLVTRYSTVQKHRAEQKEVLKQTLADWILKVRNALLQQMYNPLCPPQTPDPSRRREIFTQVSRVPVKYYA